MTSNSRALSGQIASDIQWLINKQLNLLAEPQVGFDSRMTFNEAGAGYIGGQAVRYELEQSVLERDHSIRFIFRIEPRAAFSGSLVDALGQCVMTLEGGYTAYTLAGMPFTWITLSEAVGERRFREQAYFAFSNLTKVIPERYRLTMSVLK